MTEQKAERLRSLDVFRGITIAGMILVNNPGTWSAIYPPLKHAEWHGCTPTDLIFPFFLYIVGVAITFSLTKRKEQGTDQNKLILHILRRSAVLFGLGLILAGFPYFNLSEIRIPGVLQRIGVVYFIASVMFLKLSTRNLVIFGSGFLILYWILMSFIPVPGVGYPNLGKETNMAAWIDNMILHGHMWKATRVWDPEGILSTVPAISTAILGILSGIWLRRKIDVFEKLTVFFVAGNLLMLGGYIWDGFFPMNKSIWTSSYVLYTGGLAIIFLGICYYLLDIKKINFWAKPFEVYGLNAITVFFLSGIVGRIMYLITMTSADGQEITLKDYLFSNLYLSWLDPINASLAWALSYIFIWLGLMWILYARKIFIKV
ncbi:MAG: DUF5009 domain-containing protein [Ignavibacteriales bacterium]|nr:DUF5009 domain-containing protein [Ignavibacteriales bacterium]MCF8306164.1 DUF5009 domain-containing protein [Ignavibacteriales bacterium]MCF8315782.1 DUF5009 domain-containing protein [Ignavibacteriales bacterium]MCF8437242.1 DUF5009 domain-containing protein [Ignavibacteriales bacterium]